MPSVVENLSLSSAVIENTFSTNRYTGHLKTCLSASKILGISTKSLLRIPCNPALSANRENKS